MINQVIRFLYPKRGLAKAHKKITADYKRTSMTYHESLILMARMARDPMDAKRVYRQIVIKHGKNTHQFIHLQLKRQRTQTVYERFLMILRQILGEQEPQKYIRRRKVEPRVHTRHN